MSKGKRSALVALDIGNGYTKARGPSGACSFPSVISLYSQNLDGFDFPQPERDDFIISVSGKSYAIGETVHYKGLTPITITHRSRLLTEFYRLLFMAALSQVARTSQALELVVSLPPVAYWDKERQKAALSGVYELQRGQHTLRYEIESSTIRVIPEGAGALFSIALDSEGRETGNQVLAHTAVGIVDVGTYTTDLIQLERLQVVRRGTTSIFHALKDIHNRVLAFAASEGVDLDSYRADRVLREGYFLAKGRRVPLVDRELWITELAMAIAANIRSTWNGGDDVEFIIISGGGAPLVEHLLKAEFPHVHLIETVEPFFANCEGGYRYGLFRRRMER